MVYRDRGYSDRSFLFWRFPAVTVVTVTLVYGTVVTETLVYRDPGLQRP